MKQRLLLIFILFLFSLSFTDCAKRGRPTGGPKDSIPPVIVKSSPENYSINFSEKDIRIYFDEYIKLKDLNKELIISPPLDNTPLITPLSTSKQLRIRIEDTLKPNTTYSFNFGKSIIDNNEGNAFEYFKYIFSTGTYIDSLSLKGTIKDALLLEPELYTTVMLYEVNETFHDSIIYYEKPTYITTTQDSTHTYELTNLKAGRYALIALKEKNSDYIFQPRNDHIAFKKEFITLPTDSTYVLTLFKENLDYALAKPKHDSKNHILFGFEGIVDSLELNLLTEVPGDFIATSYRDYKKDTLHYFFKPAIEKDTLLFTVSHKNYRDTLITRMRDLFHDSLQISPINAGLLTPKDTLKLTANTPITAIDTEKITVLDKDSTLLTVSSKIDKRYNIASLEFEKNEEQNYAVTLLPGAITDFFENTNDTLQYRVRTNANSDYGTLTLSLQNAKQYPYIVQLVNNRFKVVSEIYVTQEEPIYFDFINPGNYYVRIIEDKNSNKIWDTGSYLDYKQPEKVFYYPSLLDVRANWSLNETFFIK